MINPVIVYISAWMFVLALYFLKLTSNLVDVSAVGLVVLFLNMLGIVVIYMLIAAGGQRKVGIEQIDFFVDTVRSFVKFTLFVWCVGTAIEIYVGQGFPLYWKLIGDTRLYTEFGIQSFHGVMNAFYLQSLAMIAYLFLKLRQKRWVFLSILLLCWPICMLGRGILLSGLLQMTCVLLMVTRVSFSKVSALTLGGLGVVVLFGYLGDFRQTENPFAYLVSGDTADIFSRLPSGFLWFYVYLTAGLSNFFHNIDTITPGWGITYSFSNMLPTIIRNYLQLDTRNDLFVFVDQNLNTSTIYAGSVSDFGPLGGFFTVTVVQIICCYVYTLALKGRPWGIFAYTVAFQILVFSIFYDMFFLLPTLFQFAICFLLYLYYRYRVFTGSRQQSRLMRYHAAASLTSSKKI